MSLKAYSWDYGVYGSEVIIETSVQNAVARVTHPYYYGQEPVVEDVKSGMSFLNLGDA